MLISQKWPYNFFSFFWCTVSLGRYQYTVKILIWLNRPRGHFKGRKGWIIVHFEAIFSKTFWSLFLYLGMKLHREGTNELSTRFDWIALNVIFQGTKGPKRVKFCCFATCYVCIQLLGDNIDHLLRDRFDWIIRKVISKVGKVRFGQFSHNYLYYSIVTKCFPNLLHHVSSLWSQSCLKIWKVWNHSKCHFQGQKRDLFGLISQKRCA